MRFHSRRLGFALFLPMTGLFAALAADAPDKPVAPVRWRQHDIRRPKPPVVEPADSPIVSKPPADAIILFDGSSLDAWKSSTGGPAKWKVTEGRFETAPGTGQIETKQTFGDIQLHVEWAAPAPPRGVGQDRGNSGIFLMGQFELQVLDSFHAETYADGQAGAIYGEYPPLFNASRPPGEWQTYDVAFRRPRFAPSGQLLEPARVTLFHNGILVQNNEEPFGPTSWLKWLPYTDQGDRGPIALQDHSHPVRYRNIWLRELPERPAPTEEQKGPGKAIEVSSDELDALAGIYATSGGKGTKMTITRRGDYLTYRNPVRPIEARLVPIAPLHFEMNQTDGRLIFQKDDGGRVTGATLFIGDSGGSPLTRVKP